MTQSCDGGKSVLFKKINYEKISDCLFSNSFVFMLTVKIGQTKYGKPG